MNPITVVKYESYEIGRLLKLKSEFPDFQFLNLIIHLLLASFKKPLIPPPKADRYAVENIISRFALAFLNQLFESQ
jgi:hypothetical protein